MQTRTTKREINVQITNNWTPVTAVIGMYVASNPREATFFGTKLPNYYAEENVPVKKGTHDACLFFSLY